MIQIEESNPSFESCSDCIHSDDSEETCILRRCIHAVAQLNECYVPKQPTEIVRCKDCKYWMPHSQLGFDEDNGTYHDYCAKLVPEDEYYAFYRNADDYCSRAERKTDE